ncbi:MAG: hypothetical protein ABI175_16145 [Polyangiales bacterium]
MSPTSSRGRLPLLLLAIAAGCSGSGGDGAAPDSGPSADGAIADSRSEAGTARGCAAVDPGTVSGQTILVFRDAAAALSDSVMKVEAQWLVACNAINTDLGLDASKSDASGACGVVNVRVRAALSKGVRVSLAVGDDCRLDTVKEADCAARCNAAATCSGCTVDATCIGLCRDLASANVTTCTGVASWTIMTEAPLEAALVKNAAAVGAAFEATAWLKNPINELSAKYGAALKAKTGASSDEGICIANTIAQAAGAQAALNVCVGASASVEGKGSL